MRLRTVVFWMHLATGVAAGSIILLMSATGAILAVERPAIAWAERGARRDSPPPAHASAGLAEIVKRVLEREPKATVLAVTRSPDPSAPVLVRLQEGRVLLVARRSGALLAESAPRVRAFFRSVETLHRSLGAAGDRRATGRSITGACNIAFLFLVPSGLFLWWPRRWSQPALRGIIWFQAGNRGRARDFNLHNTVGFWAALPLLFIIATGSVISYRWASDLVFRIAGEEPPPRREREPARAAAGRASLPDAAAAREAADRAWPLVESRVAGWRTIATRPSQATVAFTIDSGDGAHSWWWTSGRALW